MKKCVVISVGKAVTPIASKELATLTWMLAQPTGRQILSEFGLTIPSELEVTVNTPPDDPPDLSACECGFEITEFPPNQSSICKIHEQLGGQAMSIPAIHRTGKDFMQIKAEVEDPGSPTNSLVTGGHFSVADEIEALEKLFLALIDGPRSKDVPGNAILLLDQRNEGLTDWEVGPAVRQAIAKKPPKHIRLVVVVRANECVRLYP